MTTPIRAAIFYVVIVASSAALPRAATPAEVEREAVNARVHAFEPQLWAPTPPGEQRKYVGRPADEQRPIVDAFFATLKTPAEKVAFLHVGASRYVYAINRELFGEYAVRLLRDDDAKVRQEAVRGIAYNQLRQYGPALEALLADPDVKVRAQAWTTLARFARHDLLPRMADAVRTSGEEGERITALYAIGTLLQDKPATAAQRDAVLAVVSAYLVPEAPASLRQAALYALESATPAELNRHSAAVIRQASAAEPKVREAAVAALARVEGDAAVAAIRVALSDADNVVRRAAARAAGGRKDAAAAAGIIKLLDDEEAWVRVAGIEALAALGDDPKWLAAIARGLSDPNTPVRKRALEALEAAKATAFADGVAALLKDADADVRMYAARAIAAVGSKKHAPAAAALCADDYYPTRLWALRALDKLDARDQRAVVERLTRDPERMVVEEAKQVLEKWDAKGR
jgi:HEAT repeat protein